jgi:hypothetical protein
MGVPTGINQKTIRYINKPTSNWLLKDGAVVRSLHSSGGDLLGEGKGRKIRRRRRRRFVNRY